MTPKWITRLRNLRPSIAPPCSKAIAWCRRFHTAQAAWDACQVSSWMWWLTARCLPLDQHYELALLVDNVCYGEPRFCMLFRCDAIRMFLPECPL